MRLTGVVYFDFDLSTPWVLEAPASKEIVGKVMRSGSCRFLTGLEEVERSRQRVVCCFLGCDEHPYNPLLTALPAGECAGMAGGTAADRGQLAVNSLSWWAPQIREGDVVRWPLVDCPTAPIHEIGRALGRRLRVEEITPGEAREELTAIMAPFIIEMLLAAWGAGLGQPAFVTSTVEELLGAPARSFYVWARDHAARFAV